METKETWKDRLHLKAKPGSVWEEDLAVARVVLKNPEKFPKETVAAAKQKEYMITYHLRKITDPAAKEKAKVASKKRRESGQAAFAAAREVLKRAAKTT
jgi:hypothetical protein